MSKNALTIITPASSSFTQPASFHPLGTVAPFPQAERQPCRLARSAASERPESSSSIGVPSSTSQRRRRPVLLEVWEWQSFADLEEMSALVGKSCVSKGCALSSSFEGAGGGGEEV